MQLHETAIVDESADIGQGTKIWHWVHVCHDAAIGENCVLGQNVYIGPNVAVGDNVKIQNNVSIYDGVTLENDVFVGPSAVFTNVNNPRSAVDRSGEFRKTLVRVGATIGANATIICGAELGRWSFVGAGTVVTRDVPDYALVVGTPARQIGWMCRCGERLADVHEPVCGRCGARYRLDAGSLRALERQ